LIRTRINIDSNKVLSEKIAHGEYVKTTLPSGLRVVSEYLPHVRSVSIGAWFDAGSRDETAEENGISHFLEHMVFKGTTKRNVKEIARSIESVGGYLNAFTGKEQTCYYVRALDEHCELALDVLSDLTIHSTFPVNEIVKEKTVIIEELHNVEDDPDDYIHDVLDRTVFPEHPLGFPVIGLEENVRSFTRDHLVERRNNYYTADRAVIAGAGNIRHDRFVELVEKYFHGMKRKNKSNIVRVKPASFKPKSIMMKRSMQQAHLCLGTPTMGVRDERRYAMLLLNTYLGDGMSSRLFQEIREKLGYAYSVYSFANLLSDAGIFGVYVGADKKNLKKALASVYKEFDRLASKSLSEKDLERSKSQVKGELVLSLESAASRMMRLGNSELQFGRTRSVDSILKKIDAIESKELLSIAKEFLHPGKFASITFIPQASHNRSTGE
jgi:predicted Zn-dependent peptidase